jgi:hypothetical protein
VALTPRVSIVASPNKPRPADPFTAELADMLARIEKNYGREGSGPGSRFEGRLLEDAQAEALMRRVASYLLDMHPFKRREYLRKLEMTYRYPA